MKIVMSFIVSMLMLTTQASASYSNEDYLYCQDKGWEGHSFYSCLGGRSSHGSSSQSDNSGVGLLLGALALVIVAFSKIPSKPYSPPISKSPKVITTPSKPKSKSEPKIDKLLEGEELKLVRSRFTGKPIGYSSNKRGLLNLADDLFNDKKGN